MKNVKTFSQILNSSKWTNIIFFITSFASAAGNVIFVMLSRDETQSYVKYYNIISSTVGLITLLALPILISAYRMKTIVSYFVLLSMAFLILSFMKFGALFSLISAAILLTLSFEYFVIRGNNIVGILVFRISFLISGFFPLFFNTEAALILRVLLLLIVYVVGVYYAVKKDVKNPSMAVEIPKFSFFAMNVLNVAWVYVFPLILINSANSFQSKIIYLFSNVLPLIFFKIEDTIFKIDILSSLKSNISSKKILNFSGVVLSIVYIILYFVCYLTEFFNLNLMAIYVILSIVAVIINIHLMGKIIVAKRA